MVSYQFDNFYEKKYSYIETEISFNYIIGDEIYFACTALIDPKVEIHYGDAEDGNEVEYDGDMEFDLGEWSLYDKNDNELSLKQASQILNCSEEELNNVITKVKEDSKNVLEDDLLKNLDENADVYEGLESWDWDSDYYDGDEERDIYKEDY